MSRIRILPLLIFVAALMLPIKLGNVWQGVTEVVTGLRVPAVLAQQKQPAAPEDGKKIPKLGDALPEGVSQIKKTDEKTADIDDPTRFTQSEIQLLQDLSARRTTLDTRERQLAEREALLKAAEQRLVATQKELNSTRMEIEGLLKQRDEQQKARVRQLVAIYENMKPKDAATIFNELDMKVLIGVIENMKERKVAPIIAAMVPKRARQITRALAEQKQPKKAPVLPK